MNKKLFFSLVGIFVIVYTLVYTTYYYKNNKQDSSPVNEPKEDIIYREIEDYDDIVTTLQYKNYSTEEINNILGKLSDNNIKKLIELPYQDLKNYVDYKNFNIDNIKRYESYKVLNQDLEYNDIITKVNLNLDKEFYSEYVDIKNPDEITVLVNKFNKLSSNYVPSDLTALSYSSAYKMRKEAAESFDKLQAYGLTQGVSFYPYSAYRSYESQKIIYNRYVSYDGVKNADTYSARAGYSEHQTGLAVDIKSTGYSELINKHYNWLKENSYKYGFIIRYIKDNENITGYQEEPWHLRYIGEQHATKVHDLNITYDEYYDLYIKEY